MKLRFILGILVFFIHQTYCVAEVKRIAVASEKELKKNTVRASFQGIKDKHLFPNNIEFDVVGFDAKSDIAEQPVGLNAGIMGVHNRLQNLKKIVQGSKFDYLVSIENFIQPTRAEDLNDFYLNIQEWMDNFGNGMYSKLWEDIAAVAVYDFSNDVTEIDLSVLANFPALYAKLAYDESVKIAKQANKETGMVYFFTKIHGFDITAGKMIAKMNPGIDHTNWHEKLSSPPITREEQMKSAVVKALLKLFPR